MCIAVYKPQGYAMPSKKTFSNCFSSNDDGAGFMFPVNGKVHYEKGFMSFTAFKKGLKAAVKKYGIDTKQTPMVFHFRITSQGGVKPQLTHPFPVCKSYDKMRELKGDVDVACVHNGIIDFASDYRATDYSDTMEFTKEVLYPLVHGKETTYFKNKTLMGLIKYLLGSNRYAIMDKSGHVELLGNWIEEKGVFYSNTSYKDHSFVPTSKITKGWYYDTFDQDFKYGEDNEELVDGFYDAGTISKQQEEEFLSSGMLMCDCCKDEMVIEFIDSKQCCYAMCCNCGTAYRLTNKAEDYAWEHGLVSFYDDEDADYKAWNASFGGAY